jgi:hypothetical protein
MRELLVSLDISTRSLTLAELSVRLGYSLSNTSHNVGDPRPRHASEPADSIWNETLWRLDSDAPKAAPLEQHLQSLMRQMPPGRLLRVGLLPDDSIVRINLGVLFDSYTVSVSITQSELQIINAYSATIDISCYPTNFATDR